MLAASAKAKAKAGFVENDDRNGKQQQGNRGGEVEAFEQKVLEERILCGNAERFLRDARPGGDDDVGLPLSLNGPGDRNCHGGRHHVERGAADCLVGL
ncbi:hypothetical protein SDC9_109265 [bioreactor metagenome]|uniref:Uncharacterized protein n=1 Tax=bioreactor metagenome TaxID=1076179 RepID=A0A645BKR2_9ZZZZ